MTEQIQSELISRRTAFSLIGLALPATILALSAAEAQTAGEERREDRQERREDRREDREERREERRDIDIRSGIVDEPATTGSTAPIDANRYHGGPKSDD